MGRDRQSHSKEQWLLPTGLLGSGGVCVCVCREGEGQNMCFCGLGLWSAVSQHDTPAWAPRVWVSPFLLG